MNHTKPPLPRFWKLAIVVLGLALVAYAALFPAPAADNCVASGDWSGNKGAVGTETLAPITTSRTYNLTCSWSDTRATQTEIAGLAPATWFFAMTAVNQRLVESARTNIVTKTTGSASAQESIGITVNPRPNPPTNVTAT